MSDLNAVMVFARVVQLGSFSKAAKALSMPLSTVSHKVAELEARLGATLLQRTTRKLSLTRHGKSFYDQCAVHLRAIEDAEAMVMQSQHQPEGLLRVTVPVAIGRGPLIDLVSRFLEHHPQVRMDLMVTNRYVDLVADNIDLAIRFGHLKDSNVIAKRLGHSRRLLVAAPEYLRKFGTPRHPRDLEAHQAVLFHGEQEERQWHLVNGRSRVRVAVKGMVSGSDFNTVHELARRGHGIAFLMQAYHSDPAQDAQLTRVLPTWSSEPWPVHVLYTSRKFLPLRARLFLQQLLEWKNDNWQ